MATMDEESGPILDDPIERSTNTSAYTQEFIDRHASSVHPLFGARASEMYSYETKDIDHLRDTLKALRSDQNLQNWFGYDLLDANFTDVISECERAFDACSKHAASEESWKHNDRRATRTEYAKAVTDMLPDDLDAIFGGLAVVFAMTAQDGRIRERILASLGEIPEIIIEASVRLKSLRPTNRESPHLYGTLRDLHVTLLKSLPAMIEGLYPSTFARAGESQSGSAILDPLLFHIKEQGATVRGATIKFPEAMLVDSNNIGRDTLATVDAMRGETREILSESRDIKEILVEIDRRQRRHEQVMEAAIGKDFLNSFLVEFLAPGYREPSISSEPATLPEYEPSTGLTPNEVFHIMRVDHFASMDMQKHIISSFHTMDRSARELASSMVHEQPVKYLLQVRRSGIVLVNGQFERSKYARITPLTCGALQVVHALEKGRDARNLVLSFFCAQHCDTRDDLAGPKGLMRSLIAYTVLQLLQFQYFASDEKMWFEQIEGEYANLPMEDLSRIFVRLVGILPADASVVCIIESITFYEEDEWRRDFDKMLKCFSGLVNDRSVAATFRILCTGTRLSRLNQMLQSNQIVSLRRSSW